MTIAAPDVVWTPLPPDFVHETLAAVDRTVLLGSGRLVPDFAVFAIDGKAGVAQL